MKPLLTGLLCATLLTIPITGEAKTMLEIEKNWNYSQPEKTRQIFLEEQKNLSLEKEPELFLQLLTQLARTHSLQAQFKEAHALLEQVKTHWDKASPLVKTRYFLERGRTFNSAKDKDKALIDFQEALTLAQQHQFDFYAVDAAHMLGIAAPSEEQIMWNEKAIQMAEAAKEERAKNWLGSLYNNLGWTYHDLKDYPKALAIFEKNVEWHTQKQTKEGLMIAKWSVARVYRSLGQYEKALAAQQAIAQEQQILGLPEGGYTYEEIAENLLALKRPEEAAEYFGKAYALLSQDTWLQKNEAERLERMKKLSRI